MTALGDRNELVAYVNAVQAMLVGYLRGDFETLSEETRKDMAKLMKAHDNLRSALREDTPA